MNYILKSQRQLTSEGPDLYRIVTVQTLLKTIHLLSGLAKSKYRRFSRPTSTAMHKRRPKNQAGLNCNTGLVTGKDLDEVVYYSKWTLNEL